MSPVRCVQWEGEWGSSPQRQGGGDLPHVQTGLSSCMLTYTLSSHSHLKMMTSKPLFICNSYIPQSQGGGDPPHVQTGLWGCMLTYTLSSHSHLKMMTSKPLVMYNSYIPQNQDRGDLLSCLDRSIRLYADLHTLFILSLQHKIDENASLLKTV